MRPRDESVQWVQIGALSGVLSVFLLFMVNSVVTRNVYVNYKIPRLCTCCFYIKGLRVSPPLGPIWSDSSMVVWWSNI